MDQCNTTVSTETVQQNRKPYTTPALTDFGSFAEITHGTFVGGGIDNGVYS